MIERMSRYSLLVVLILLICRVAIAQDQLSAFTIHQKIADGQLYVRVQPNSLAAFQHLINTDIQLEVYEVSGNLPKVTLRQVDKRVLASTPLAQWQASLSASQWDSIALTSIYGRQLEEAFLAKTFLAPEYQDTEASAWQHRWLFSNYSLNYSWATIEQSGFGYRHPRLEAVDRLALKLYPGLQNDTIWIDVDQANYRAPSVPDLEAVFKDRRVELQWRTLAYRPHYFGWYLDRSLDDGQSWEPIFELPLMNPNDTITNAKEALKSLYYEDVLPDNEVAVRYRLQGADYFGDRSENASIVEGQGREDIRVSPLLLETIQTDSNYAVINWDFPEEQEKLLQEFRIYETDTTGQNYRLAAQAIPPSRRMIALPMKFQANFYRVQAVSTQGTELTSFESLVMSYDVTPPATPQSFSGYIDSTGLAHFNWIPSNEPDLAGYYLFKGYFENQELAMITPLPISGPAHVDTVNMEVGNEWVYYQLRSVDYRGNGSAFTPILAVKKPDVFPPGASQFLVAESQQEKVYLEWTGSPSADAVEYELYRRNLTTESDFTLLYEFSQGTMEYTYLDSLVQTENTYAYTMITRDDDGLESEPSQPVILRIRASGLGPDIRSSQASLVDNSVHLSWEYPTNPMGFNIYRSLEEEPLILLKSVHGSSRLYIDDRITLNKGYQYRIQAVFTDGRTSPFTENIRVSTEPN